MFCFFLLTLLLFLNNFFFCKHNRLNTYKNQSSMSRKKNHLYAFKKNIIKSLIREPCQSSSIKIIFYMYLLKMCMLYRERHNFIPFIKMLLKTFSTSSAIRGQRPSLFTKLKGISRWLRAQKVYFN